jgi:hypothetical protein
MRAENAFRLSRIQAEGWKAARGLPLAGREDFDSAMIDQLNPYSTVSERARWVTGFLSALETSRG